MSSVLFLSRNAEQRNKVETVLTAAGHVVTTSDADNYRAVETLYDCVVVDTGRKSHELVALLKWAGNCCIIGVYATDLEHLEQKRSGALWCIPTIVDVADELKDGPLSIEQAIPVSQLTIYTVGLSAERIRMYAGLQDFLCSFKTPKGGVRALFEAYRKGSGQ